eukprot:370508-Karenia_brevis.AAC.1
MDIVDTQVWEMGKGDREYVDFDWTSARVANDVVDLPNPDVPNDYWLANLKKEAQGAADVPVA